MKQFGRLIFLTLLLVPLNLKASITDTIIALEHVVAKGVKFEKHAVGSKIVTVDSAMMANYQMQSVADLLAHQSIVNVTTYGPGGHATIKMRGGGSDHTTIIWNGLNLKPAMSGELNCSMLNVNMFDDIRIQPGGSSTMYGSGASTGVVHLSNKLNPNNKGLLFNASLEGGAYNFKALDSYGLTSSIGYSGKKVASRISFGYQDYKNEFEYQYSKKQRKTQEHAASNTISLLQQNTIKLGTKSRLETDLVYIKHFKQVPSLITNLEPGKAEQTDDNLHLAINYAYYGQNWFLKYRGGYLNYHNAYLGFDTAYYHSLNQSWTYSNEIESKFELTPNQEINLGYKNTIEKARSSSYLQDELRNQNALFGRYLGNYWSRKIQINIEGRQVVTDGEFIPFVYSAGINFKFLKGFNLKALGSKLYTLPDLNDLYWKETSFAAGNPDLTPEYGWSAEIGLKHSSYNSKITYSHEITVYRSDLKDAIIWLPREDGKYQPDNYTESSTNGLEFLGNTNFKIRTFLFNIAYDYAFTNAKLVDNEFPENNGKQRRYIPKHKTGIKARVEYNSTSIGTYTTYTSERYIDYASDPLKGYTLLDMDINHKFKIKESQITLTARIRNLLNANYQIMSGYAQPSRSFLLGIAYNLKP